MRSSLLVSLALVSTLAAGCVADPADPAEPLGEAAEAQLDPGYLNFRKVSLVFADTAHTPLGEIHILKRAAGGRFPGTEYWYVNKSATSLLASTPVDITISDSDVEPPQPDYPNLQAFTEVEYPTSGWGSAWTVDPLSGGKLLGNGHGLYLRLNTSTSGAITRVAWYQVIPATQSPVYLSPSGRFVGNTSNSVTVPSGYRGYDIAQTAP